VNTTEGYRKQLIEMALPLEAFKTEAEREKSIGYGRCQGAATVKVTKNEALTALNKPEDFILASVQVDGEQAAPWYVAQPFQREPDFGVTSVNYDLAGLLARAEALR
jgi:hypothetical protein